MEHNLVARQFYGNNRCYDNNNNLTNCSNSGWYNWGRWVALGAIIVGAILIFFVFSLISARRRRRMGRQPYRATGWVPFTGHGPATYNPNYPQQEQQTAPPSYNQPQQYGGYYGENQGYFGGRQTEQDTEMQRPGNTYGGDSFAPPAGPPPAKK